MEVKLKIAFHIITIHLFGSVILAHNFWETITFRYMPSIKLDFRKINILLYLSLKNFWSRRPKSLKSDFGHSIFYREKYFLTVYLGESFFLTLTEYFQKSLVRNEKVGRVWYGRMRNSKAKNIFLYFFARRNYFTIYGAKTIYTNFHRIAKKILPV